MNAHHTSRRAAPELGRPFRVADYANPPSGRPFPVGAEQAASIKAEDESAQFYVDGCRVYPKPSIGTFAKWPGETLRFGETAPETELHLAAKTALAQVVSEGQSLKVQPVRVRSGIAAGKVIGIHARACRIEAHIRVKRARSNLTPDALILTRGGLTGHWVGIEFRNTHAVDYRKRRKLQRLPMTTLEVDVREFGKSFWPGDTLVAALADWFRTEFPARVITLVGETESRQTDDPVLQRALRS